MSFYAYFFTFTVNQFFLLYSPLLHLSTSLYFTYILQSPIADIPYTPSFFRLRFRLFLLSPPAKG